MATVNPGTNTAKVKTQLDWQSGDQLYFAPTAMQATHSDYATIDEYNSETGDLTLTTGFSFYHWGQEPSTFDSHGVDMRGEVVLLSRNIQIEGSDEDGWGCTILTTDLDDISKTPVVQLSGRLIWDNVEVTRCSQRDTERAAVRFNGAIGRSSSISQSVVHTSQAWSLLVTNSRNIDIVDSSFIGAKAVGVNLNSITNVHLDGVFVADVIERNITALDHEVDKRACVAFCSYYSGKGVDCPNSSIKNSIAAGCPFGGFVAPGNDCGSSDSDSKFFNNVAHSVDGSGAYIYPDPGVNGQLKCYEGSNFAAYKNTHQGLTTMYKTQEMKMRSMSFVDNMMGGLSLQVSGTSDSQKIVASEINIYGESDAQDCPDAAGAPCMCKNKFGFMLASGVHGSKELHPIKETSLPIEKIKSYGSFAAEVEVTDVNFINFSSATACGKSQQIFKRNPTSADYIPMH